MGRTSSITVPSMVEIVGRAPAVDKNVWCFYFFCFFMSRFGITKFVIAEMPWRRVIFKTIMVPLHRGRFLVVHLYLSFSMDPGFFLGGRFIQKIAIFGDFGGRKATFLKPQWWKFAQPWRPGRPSPAPNFVKKKYLRGYRFWANIYQKLPIFAILGAVSLHF